MKKLRIDIIADFVCPWSEIGYRHLKSAIYSVKDQIQPEIHWQPYELNPVLPPQGINLYQHLKKRHKLSDHDLNHRIEKIKSLADDCHFPLQLNNHSYIYNTRKAHQLLLWSTAVHDSEQLRQKICNAYFYDNADISSEIVLVNIGTSIGMKAADIEQIIQDSAWENAVINTEKQWLDAGINKTPTMIFEQSHILSGVRSQTEYAQYIRQLLPELKYVH